MSLPSIPTALVTGASGGIGLELARLFVRDGYRTIVVARDTPRLQAAEQELNPLVGGQMIALPADLVLPGAAAALARQLGAQSLEVDVLVNNAGFGVFGPFAETDPAEQDALLHLNVVALTELTRALLPGMLSRGRGRIMNVASTAAFVPGGPLMSTYYASKAYVLSFSQALFTELAGTGVTVTALCPGPTWSGFQARAGIEGIRMLSGFVMTSESVAEAGYRGMLQGERLVVPGWQNTLVRLGSRFVPTDILLRIVHTAQQRRRGH